MTEVMHLLRGGELERPACDDASGRPWFAWQLRYVSCDDCKAIISAGSRAQTERPTPVRSG